MWRCFVVRTVVLLPILVALTDGVGAAAAAGMEGARAPVAIRAPLSEGVLRTMARRRVSADAAVADYWTADRMGAAGQAPGVRAGAGQRLPLVRTMASRRVETRPYTLAKEAHEMDTGTGGIASRTVGKVFFRNAVNGRDYSCSAAVVNSPSRNLISTAGHCVYDRGSGWHQNWVFVPFFDRGRRPYGIWRATWLAAFTGWVEGTESDLDVAFVKVAAADGGSLVDVVGGNGIRVGFSSRTRRLTILGYPFLPPYPGDRQYYCQGVTMPAGRRLRMACPLTTGASGGPWLEEFDPATGCGYIDGVTTNTDLANTTLWSPPFDDGVWVLYRFADRL
jgi:V8-like Glu-specific endopeptidase